MMKKMENGETVIGMLRHVIIGLRYRSRKCTLSWTSDNEEEYTEVTEISEEMSDEAERPLTKSCLSIPFLFTLSNKKTQYYFI